MKNMRMRLLQYFLFIVIVILSLEAEGQIYSEKELEEASAKKLTKEAEKRLQIGDSYTAIDLYERAIQKDPGDFKALNRLADIYYMTRDYHKAEETYGKIVESFPKSFPEARFYFALMQKMNGHYAKARENFELFQKEYKVKKDDKNLKKKAKLELEGIEQAVKMVNNPLSVKITHLDSSINMAYTEFAPVLQNGSTLIYSSLKSDSIVIIDPENPPKEPFIAKLYYAEKKGNKWISKGEFPGPFNHPVFETGNGSFSPDKKKFYFTRCSEQDDGSRRCEIYLSEWNEDYGWGLPERLPDEVNHPKYTSSQPAVGIETRKNQEVLYFVSDRPEGYGGMDIWYSIYDEKKQEYQTAKNASRKLNTTGDEMTPYYDTTSKTLYFSSNGHPSMGGLDIFQSQGQLKKWSEPENIGFPINSSVDDLYYVADDNEKTGFFVSNREGGVALKNPTCCDDIYSFKWVYVPKFFIEGLVVDDDSNAVTGAVVSLFQIDDDTGEEILVNNQTTKSDGKYLFQVLQNKNYKVMVHREGSLNNNKNASTKGLTKSDTINTGSLTLSSIKKLSESEGPLKIYPIYYETDKHELLPEAKNVIDTTLLPLLKNNPSIIVEIGAHTDSVSSDEYNVALSQRRAKGVVDYLINKGIDKKRLQYKGYGETKPIASNATPEGRAKNRRTELKIVGELEEKIEIEYEDEGP